MARVTLSTNENALYNGVYSVVNLLGEPVADDLLSEAGAVAVCRVYEVAPVAGEGVQDLVGHRLRHLPRAVQSLAKNSGSSTQFYDT